MICPVCHLELSKASLRSHLSVDHSERQLQLSLQADAVPVSNANREIPVVLTPEAKELLSQLNHARRLHNQNLLSQRKALSALSRTLVPASPLKGSINKADVKGYPQRLQNGSYSPRGSIDQMLVQPAQGKHAGTNFAADVTACSCRMHQRAISSLEVNLREKKKQVIELTQKLKQEMEKLEDKEMVISDLNTFLQETAEKQSNARAQLEGYMDNLITRTVQAENEVKNLQMLSSPSSSMNRSSGSFSPRGTPGVALRVERRQKRSPSMELKRTLQEIRWKDGKGTPSSSSAERTSSPPSITKSPFHISSYQAPKIYQPEAAKNGKNHTSSGRLQLLRSLTGEVSHPQERPQIVRGSSGLNSLRGSSSARLERLLYQQELSKGEEETKLWHTQTPRFSLTGSVSSNEDSSTISVSSLSGLSSSSLEGGGTIPSGDCHLDRLSASQRHFILHSVMEFLDIDSKLGCAVVCKEWRSLSRRPSLWRHVILDKRRISSKFLRTVSSWCLELQTLKLSRIKPPTKRRPGETKEVYQKRTRGILDDAIESLLAASQNNLMIVKITSCQQLLTKKSYLKIAQYCPCLNILKLDDCAIRTEVIRSFAKGCKQLTSLQIVPDAKRDGNKNMTNSNLHLIGSTWYQLQALSMGGKNFSKSGLLSVVENCQLLQILELSRAQKVNEDAAKKMCRVGLKELHTFLFTNTIVTPQAILHLYVSCPRLKSIRVYLHLSDVYPGRDNADQYREKFDDAVSELQRLKEHPGLGAVLQVRADID